MPMFGLLRMWGSGLLAVRYGARKSRYIGSAEARLQAAWAAALVNLNPIGQRLNAHNA